jgi:hypothetical protein
VKATYYLKGGPGANWREVTEAEFVQAERVAGFAPKPSLPQDKPATNGFVVAGGVQGKVRYDLRGTLNPVFNAVEEQGK